MTELWKCPPSVFEDQPEEMIDLHIQIYVEELKARELDGKREAQKTQKP